MQGNPSSSGLGDMFTSFLVLKSGATIFLAVFPDPFVWKILDVLIMH